MSELEEARVEALKWKTLAETKTMMEHIGEGLDQFHLEKQLENLQEKFQIMKMLNMDRKKQLKE
jgi:hypothetical protein